MSTESIEIYFRLYSSVGFFLAVIIFLSVAGNLLVCIAVYTDRYVGFLIVARCSVTRLPIDCFSTMT